MDKDAFEARMKQYTSEREDLATPSTLDAAYICSDLGTEIDAIEPFMLELTGLVETMKEELANETRILEGTLEPVYSEAVENELSKGETKEDQWTTDLPNGFLRTAPTRTSTPVSSSSLSTARPSSPVSPMLACAGKSCSLRTGCCKEMSDASGCAIDAMNECSECTVPTISELTPGMPSDPK